MSEVHDCSEDWFGHCYTCGKSMLENEMIAVGESEDGTLKIFGTHGSAEASEAAVQYAEDHNLPSADSLARKLAEAFDDPKTYRWADPAVLHIEGDYWPDPLTRSEYVEGWIPYLVVPL